MIQGVDFIDVMQMAAALTLRHNVHFADDQRRQNFPGSPHHDTECILLRGPADDISAATWQAEVAHENTRLLAEWPSARIVLDQISESHFRRTERRPIFGKIMVVSLRPGGWVDWHVDEGSYAMAHDRFHLCLCPSPAALLYSGAAVAALPMGQLTFVNNRIPHCATNFGVVPRVHLIVDIRKPETVQ